VRSWKAIYTEIGEYYEGGRVPMGKGFEIVPDPDFVEKPEAEPVSEEETALDAEIEEQKKKEDMALREARIVEKRLLSEALKAGFTTAEEYQAKCKALTEKEATLTTEAELLRVARGRHIEATNDYARFKEQVGDLNGLRRQSVSKINLIAESVFGMLVDIAEAMDRTAGEFGSRFTRDRYSVMIANTFFYRFLVSLAGEEIEIIQYGKLRPDQDPEKVLCIDSLADWLRKRRADALENAGITEAIALLSRGLEAPDDINQRLALQTTEPEGEFDESEEEQPDERE